MKNHLQHLRLIVVVAVLSVLMFGCGHHAETPAVRPPTIDLSEVPVHWSDTTLTKIDSARAYIFNTPCLFYLADSNRMKIADTLAMGDSLMVFSADMFSYKPIFYPAIYKGKKGYINGLGLGHKAEADFDGDGKIDRILFGYTHLDTTALAEIAINPVIINFIAANGKQYSLQDSGYSEMQLELYDSVRFRVPTKCFQLSSGYPACGYEQHLSLIAFSNGKPEIIHHGTSMMDSGYGTYYEYLMPVDSTHRMDTIYVRHGLSEAFSEESDSIVSHILDSTVIYPTGNGWKKVFYDLDTSPKN